MGGVQWGRHLMPVVPIDLPNGGHGGDLRGSFYHAPSHFCPGFYAGRLSVSPSFSPRLRDKPIDYPALNRESARNVSLKRALGEEPEDVRKVEARAYVAWADELAMWSDRAGDGGKRDARLL